uniref:Uncharacterized protein n=1 Tax=Anguilla anguilla TaxID=7936 RepID=A0A0E9WUQ7_ANGAN
MPKSAQIIRCHLQVGSTVSFYCKFNISKEPSCSVCF